MPKDEFDPEDPMELFGVGILTTEDTTEAMTECFIEEFMRLGFNHEQILALFRNPYYTGMNMALQNKGEAFVREIIQEIFTRWGRPFTWKDAPETVPAAPAACSVKQLRDESTDAVDCNASPSQPPPINLDPLGGEIPKELQDHLDQQHDQSKRIADKKSHSSVGGGTNG